MSEPAGWYTNPDGTNSERYWDGARWTHQVRPFPTQPLATSSSEGGEPREAVADILSRSPTEIPPDVTVAADTSIPPVDSGAGSYVPPESSTSGDSPSELFSVLLDFSFERRITRPVARWAYVLGAVTTLVVVVLALLFVVQAGGSGAVLGVILWPLLGILSLVHLRSVLQAAVGAAEPDGNGSGTGPGRQ